MYYIRRLSTDTHIKQAYWLLDKMWPQAGRNLTLVFLQEQRFRICQFSVCSHFIEHHYCNESTVYLVGQLVGMCCEGASEQGVRRQISTSGRWLGLSILCVVGREGVWLPQWLGCHGKSRQEVVTNRLHFWILKSLSRFAEEAQVLGSPPDVVAGG